MQQIELKVLATSQLPFLNRLDVESLVLDCRSSSRLFISCVCTLFLYPPPYKPRWSLTVALNALLFSVCAQPSLPLVATKISLFL